MSEDDSRLLQNAQQSGDTAEKTIENVDFQDSGFFTRPGSPVRRLPTPDEVRAAARAAQQPQNFDHPSPVIFPSLGLLVKYGGGVRVAEAKCLRFIRQNLLGRVRIPEVYGWRTDSRQTFIYIEFIEGDTLEKLWPTMNDKERTTICSQLRRMVEEWRGLRQDKAFLGSIESGPLPDRIFEGAPETAGPFLSLPIFHDWYTTAIGPNKFNWEGKKPHPFRIKFPDNGPIVFTHSDLHPSNIILSKDAGQLLHVAAIIDWEQSGWYPWYWEYCKARWTSEVGAEWDERYLPQCLDVDGVSSKLDACDSDGLSLYNYWDYFVLARGA
ncbi:kinase-like domain-containing protein [Durotheca rogersii]|uniref:kinase-like domain-containing protein n=1 Tax=Durotheca rogersii TaxID=419775 RepID=UPI00221ED9E3|nr:kinase-like domain-containing protein [Durotheca rogersii]KAI5866814.1 kinase-like domain-containing protein [Durotheca rogersii]